VGTTPGYHTRDGTGRDRDGIALKSQMDVSYSRTGHKGAKEGGGTTTKASEGWVPVQRLGTGPGLPTLRPAKDSEG
jgi:hypothetical protein